MIDSSIMYQVYPLSFKDSNGDGHGDILGIIEKLDYLKDLGVDAIWLSPVFKSPMKDFGYDISDYYAIDPLFGTMEDFEKLIKEAHDRNIKVLLDYVANHTSSEHPWFQESKKSPDNTKRNWYVWRNGKGPGIPPNNWISAFGGSSWEYDPATDEWYLHDFLKEQPDLNWRNPEVKKAMIDIFTFYLDKGVDGYRMDAMAFLFEDETYPDDPKNAHYNSQKEIPWYTLKRKYDFNQPEVLPLLHELTEVASRFGNKLLISEIYDSLETLGKLYFRKNDTTHIPFNFDLMTLEWNADVFKNYLESYLKVVGDNIPNFVLSNHDQPRVATRVGQEKARLLAFLQLTLPGIAVIYYGDEIGMKNIPLPADQIKDPLGKLVDRRFGRDSERSPMQWNTASFAGFSSTQPWLPVEADYKQRNVDIFLKKEDSILQLYKNLISLRKSGPALLHGNLSSIEVQSHTVLSFQRKTDVETLSIKLNFSNQPQKIILDRAYKILFSSHAREKGISTTNLELYPYEGILLK
ncbi:MAG: alpha-amylase family glycosyl hydrolase [bacterium]|nr:alpha-amylase family glycosyl hydrolase [bacterium]